MCGGVMTYAYVLRRKALFLLFWLFSELVYPYLQTEVLALPRAYVWFQA